MEYYAPEPKIKPKNISNVEFALLQLVSQNDGICGYEINKLVEERGYREWADIGTTSVYAGLDKLSSKGLVEFYIDTKKQGKGPLPKKFSLTKEGINILKSEVLKALSSTRERDRRFDLAIASIPCVTAQEAIKALNLRKEFLSQISYKIKSKFSADGGANLPVHVSVNAGRIFPNFSG